MGQLSASKITLKYQIAKIIYYNPGLSRRIRNYRILNPFRKGSGESLFHQHSCSESAVLLQVYVFLFYQPVEDLLGIMPDSDKC